MEHPLNKSYLETKRLPSGVWGGEHISLRVTERDATVEFDCAHATIARKIVPDGRGRFNVTGTYFQEHGGPVRAGGEPGGDAVRFKGQVTGKTLKLTVARAGAKEIIGTFTLVHHQEPLLVKCR